MMILVGMNYISRSSDEEEALWESMIVCLFTTLWQKFNCAVLTVCTANEYKELDSNREKAQRRSGQVESYLEESRKSECRKDDPHGHRT